MFDAKTDPKEPMLSLAPPSEHIKMSELLRKSTRSGCILNNLTSDTSSLSQIGSVVKYSSHVDGDFFWIVDYVIRYPEALMNVSCCSHSTGMQSSGMR